MMTVKQVSKYTGVSIRTLQYYDRIGLLKATAYTEAGYRLYDDTALEQLQQILLFRVLEFSLKDIQRILSSSNFDRNKALQQQIELLELKKEHIENLITFARGVKLIGGKYMDFSVFDKKKLDNYARQAKESWGQTEAYMEFEEKSKGRTADTEGSIAEGLMAIFAELGQIKDTAPESKHAQALVRKLQSYITEHYYNCTKKILLGLGQIYAAGGTFTENIDAVGGPGTAIFANASIEAYCRNR